EGGQAAADGDGVCEQELAGGQFIADAFLRLDAAFQVVGCARGQRNATRQQRENERQPGHRAPRVKQNDASAANWKGGGEWPCAETSFDFPHFGLNTPLMKAN